MLTIPNSNLKGQRALQHLLDPLQSAYRTRLCPFHSVGQCFFNFRPSLRVFCPWFLQDFNGILNTLNLSTPSGKSSTTSAFIPDHNSCVIFLCFCFVSKTESSKSFSSLSLSLLWPLLSPSPACPTTPLSSSLLLLSSCFYFGLCRRFHCAH